MGKYQKVTLKIINLSYQAQHGMKSMTYVMGNIQYLIFKITLNISSENMEKILLTY